MTLRTQSTASDTETAGSESTAIRAADISWQLDWVCPEQDAPSLDALVADS